MTNGDGPRAQGRGLLRVLYHLFYVVDDLEQPAVAPPVLNGLVGADGAGAAVCTGIHTEVVDVAVQVLDAPPSALDASADWDEVAEVSVAAPAGRLTVAALMADAPDQLPVLSAAGPGPYRLRVHCLGRDANVDGVSGEPGQPGTVLERYLLQAWPGREAPAVAHRQTDSYGAQVRASAAQALLGPSGGGYDGPVGVDDPTYDALLRRRLEAGRRDT